MPKKGKKKGGKGKKGGGKGKKGAKGGGKGKAGERKKLKAENSLKLAERNAKVWETRLEVSEVSRVQYRESAQKLATENDALQDLMHRTEKDTIEVITYLKKQDQEKDDQIYKLNENLKDLKRQHRQEKEAIIADLSHQINQLEEQLASKTNDIQLMQNELKMVKEFRKKRSTMQKELDEIKEALFIANKDHKDTLGRMEQKFFEEKMRLQQEANQKIAELAERAHIEAIKNLDETTRSVYKENVRVNEALSYHMTECSRLEKIRDKLKAQNESIAADKELADMMIQDKVQENLHLKKQIREAQEKVEILEKALSHSTLEFERQNQSLKQKSATEQESSHIEIARLQRLLELRAKESSRVKRLARNILDQRSELERFFHESLDAVRKKIHSHQTQYRKDAQQAYNRRMLAAHAGEADFPPVRTFGRAEKSTNSVFRDLRAAESMMDLQDKVDISELTWEQKERVIRYLFARMNGTQPPSASSADMQHEHEQHLGEDTVGSAGGPGARTVLPAIQAANAEVLRLDDVLPEEEDLPDETFLTQKVVHDPDTKSEPVKRQHPPTPDAYPEPDLTAKVITPDLDNLAQSESPQQMELVT